MTPRQIELIRLDINILTAWVDTLEFKLRHSFVQDEPPIQNQIANYKNLVSNLQIVLNLEKEKNPMKIKMITTYNFSELSEKAQQNAINKNFDCNTFYDWWDRIYEDAKTIGLKITGFNIDRNRNAQGTFTEPPSQVVALIRANHGSESETFGTAFWHAMELERQAIATEEKTKADPEYDPDYDLVLQIRREETEKWFLQQLLEDYSIMLQKEFEHQTSKEAIIETMVANEYQFLENGERA